MFAETAQLAVNLSLEGNFNAGIAKAETQLTGLNTAATRGVAGTGVLSGAMGKLGTVAGGVGGALSHAGGQLKGLITGPLGFLGLAGAALSVTGAIGKGITAAQSFGDEVRRLAALTGETSQAMSGLASAFDHFAIAPEAAQRSIGFLEKNVGLLAARKDGIVKFQQEFGLQILDTNGKIKSANDLILTTADYFNNAAIPATQKAAAISKLYGRSWQDLIPLLAAGRQGIADVQAEAAAMGLTLTADNVTALAKLKTATRDWGTALAGLEMQIGLALVPTLTDLAKSLTSFVTDHRTDIVSFFKNAAAAGKQIAGVLGDVVHGLASAWNAIPGPLRDFLLKGIVADRTIKFLFGFDPLAALGKGLLGGLGATFLSRGSPTNPMFVVPVGGAIGGAGGLAGVAGKGGFLALLGALGIGVAIDAAAIPVGQAIRGALNDWRPTDSQAARMRADAASGRGGYSGPLGSASLGLSLETRDAIAATVAEQRQQSLINDALASFGSHAEAQRGFSQRTFRGSATGAIEQFPALLKYLAGAQGSTGGPANAAYLRDVGNQIGALKHVLPRATADQAVAIKGEIKILEGILRDKRFEITAPSLVNVVQTISASSDVREQNRLNLKTGVNKPASSDDIRESNRIAVQAKQSIDYAKVNTGQKLDATREAMDLARVAIVAAIQALNLKVNISASSVTRAQSVVNSFSNPTTLNRHTGAQTPS